MGLARPRTASGLSLRRPRECATPGAEHTVNGHFLGPVSVLHKRSSGKNSFVFPLCRNTSIAHATTAATATATEYRQTGLQASGSPAVGGRSRRTHLGFGSRGAILNDVLSATAKRSSVFSVTRGHEEDFTWEFCCSAHCALGLHYGDASSYGSLCSFLINVLYNLYPVWIQKFLRLRVSRLHREPELAERATSALY